MRVSAGAFVDTPTGGQQSLNSSHSHPQRPPQTLWYTLVGIYARPHTEYEMSAIVVPKRLRRRGVLRKCWAVQCQFTHGYVFILNRFCHPLADKRLHARPKDKQQSFYRAVYERKRYISIRAVPISPYRFPGCLETLPRCQFTFAFEFRFRCCMCLCSC